MTLTKKAAKELAQAYGLNQSYQLAEVNETLVKMDCDCSSGLSEMVDSILSKEPTMFLDGAIKDEFVNRQRQLIPPPNHCFLTFRSEGQQEIMVTARTEDLNEMIAKVS